jgi:hypothetical protein
MQNFFFPRPRPGKEKRDLPENSSGFMNVYAKKLMTNHTVHQMHRDAELLLQFKEIQRENLELKRMYVDLSLDHYLLKKVIEKKLYGPVKSETLPRNWY